MLTRLKILHRDALGKNYYEYLKIRLTLQSASAAADELDGYIRTIMALTTDTYQDTDIIETVSLNEILAEGE